MWDALADIMGPAATATLVRRAVKRGSARSRGLEGLAVTRDRLEYRYTLPASWNSTNDEAVRALHELTRELQPLLVELTGSVVLNRLRTTDELARGGLFRPEVEA